MLSAISLAAIAALLASSVAAAQHATNTASFSAVDFAAPSVVGASSTVFAVTAAPFRARCDAKTGPNGYLSGSDDTEPIQAAFNAARAAGGGTVLLPGPDNSGHTGKCAVSHPIFGGFDNTTLAGAGKYASELVAMPNFTVQRDRTPYSLESLQYRPILDLDLPQAPVKPYNLGQPPLVNFTMRDVGFDPRAAQSGGVTGTVIISIRALQYFNADNVGFDLGGTPTTRDLTKAWQAFSFQALQFDAHNATHDLTFRGVSCHNGVGCVILRSDAGCAVPEAPVSDTLSNVRIENESDVVDLPHLEDDRDAFTLDFCGTGNPLFTNYVNTGESITVANSVSDGSVNGLKIEASAGGRITHLTYSHVRYQGSDHATYESGHPRGTGGIVGMEDLSKNGTSVQTEMTFSDIHGNYAAGLSLYPQGSASEPISMTVQDVDLENDMSPYCIGLIATQPPSGHDKIHLDRITCSPAPVNAATNKAQGVHMTQIGRAPGAAFTGDVELSDSTFRGYPTPVYIYPGSGSWRNVIVRNVHWDTGRPVVDRSTQLQGTSPSH